MKRSWWMVRATVVGALTSAASPALAAVLRVPAQHPTIQAAADAAAPDDVILVARGTYCGATLNKPLTLIGLGNPTVIGCDEGPALSNVIRIGFFLPGANGASTASGTRIFGFTFDGRGISNENLEPLALGVFARFANDVTVLRNRFLGTTQAITSTAGDRWVISHNEVTGLTLFDCTRFCSGGDGIVLQTARGGLAVPGGAAEPANRPEDNVVFHNSIAGAVPDGFDVFSMAGILLLAADRTTVTGNRLTLPDNPDADARGQGILVTNVCCGELTPILPGSRNTRLVVNRAGGSEVGIVVEGSGGENTEGLVLRRNQGTVEIEGAIQATARRGLTRIQIPNEPMQ